MAVWWGWRRSRRRREPCSCRRHRGRSGGRRDGFTGSISLRITGDEESPAVNGTVKVLDWMKAKGEIPDHCLVGEPSNREILGGGVKISRRGSLNGRLTVHGSQGHTAHPQLADDPTRRLMRMLTAIADRPLDDGTRHFELSRAAVTSIDVANPTPNLIPGEATGRTPELDTGGGTSNARFLKDLCPVAEFGLTSATAHKVNEAVSVDDLNRLSSIYGRILSLYFADPPCRV